MSGPAGYSEIANAQLDEIENRDNPDLYDALLDVCEFVLANPERAQSRSSALTTSEGIRFRFAVPGHHPYKIFWSSDAPRIEAVFPYA
ncbi:MAG: hypothetical protein HKL86_05430 [Acidimicrobiaceae bacterium]|nr:hypothetical protein [Acidimicrobiaceae bacterium]